MGFARMTDSFSDHKKRIGRFVGHYKTTSAGLKTTKEFCGRADLPGQKNRSGEPPHRSKLSYFPVYKRSRIYRNPALRHYARRNVLGVIGSRGGSKSVFLKKSGPKNRNMPK
jgi:hypothetical protein